MDKMTPDRKQKSPKNRGSGGLPAAPGGKQFRPVKTGSREPRRIRPWTGNGNGKTGRAAPSGRTRAEPGKDPKSMPGRQHPPEPWPPAKPRKTALRRFKGIANPSEIFHPLTRENRRSASRRLGTQAEPPARAGQQKPETQQLTHDLTAENRRPETHPPPPRPDHRQQHFNRPGKHPKQIYPQSGSHRRSRHNSTRGGNALHKIGRKSLGTPRRIRPPTPPPGTTPETPLPAKNSDFPLRERRTGGMKFCIRSRYFVKSLNVLILDDEFISEKEGN